MLFLDPLKPFRKRDFFLRKAFLAALLSALIHCLFEAKASQTPEDSNEVLYQRGLILRNEKKYEEAKRYFQPLAEQGDMKAQHNLGLCCFYLKEEKAAYEWFKAARERGLQASANNIRKMNLLYVLLPDEMLQHILSFLPFNELKALRILSKKTDSLVSQAVSQNTNSDVCLTLDTPEKLTAYFKVFPSLERPILAKHFKFKGTRDQFEQLIPVWTKKGYTHHLKISPAEVSVGSSIFSAFSLVLNTPFLDFSNSLFHAHNLEFSFETLILPSQDPSANENLARFESAQALEVLIRTNQMYEENINHPSTIFLAPAFLGQEEASHFEDVIISDQGLFLNRERFPHLYPTHLEEDGLRTAILQNIGCLHCFSPPVLHCEEAYRLTRHTALNVYHIFPKRPSALSSMAFSGEEFLQLIRQMQPLLDTFELPALFYRVGRYKEQRDVLIPLLLWPQHLEKISQRRFLFRQAPPASPL